MCCLAIVVCACLLVCLVVPCVDRSRSNVDCMNVSRRLAGSLPVPWPDPRHLKIPLAHTPAVVWAVSGAIDNKAALTGHKNAVLEARWSSDGVHIVSASADKSCGIWNAETGQRVRSWAGHTKIVNCIAAQRRGPVMAASGSDDGSIRIWDARKRSPAQSIPDCRFPVLAIAYADDGNSVFAAGVDSTIGQYDLRRGGAVTMSLSGHTEPVTGLSLSQDGNSLLSFGMDNVVRGWDVRPFVQGGDAARCTKAFTGASNNFEQNLIRCVTRLLVCWYANDDIVRASSVVVVIENGLRLPYRQWRVCMGQAAIGPVPSCHHDRRCQMAGQQDTNRSLELSAISFAPLAIRLLTHQLIQTHSPAYLWHSYTFACAGVRGLLTALASLVALRTATFTCGITSRAAWRTYSRGTVAWSRR